MKRNRLQRRVRAEVEKLTGPQKDYLVFGRSLLERNEPFRDEAHRQAMWEQHGEAIIEACVLKYPGRRPFAWWIFDAPEPIQDGESQPHYLRRLGLLGEDEIERLTDDAYKPQPRRK